MTRDDYPALTRAFGLYWDEDAKGGPHGSLSAYLADGADDAPDVLRDVEALLASGEDLRQACRTLGMRWDLAAFGLTYEEFFTSLRDALRGAAATDA